MNPGQQSESPADVEQQKIANAELHNYAKTNLPALGYLIHSTKDTEPGAEEQFAGKASGSARVAENVALNATRAKTSDMGVSGNSGAAVGKAAGILTKGAGVIGSSAAEGRSAQKDNYYASQIGILQQGDAMLNKANHALVTAGGVSDAIQSSRNAQDSQRQSEAASLGTTALLAFA